VKGCDVNVHSQDSIDFNSSSDVWNTYVKQYLDMKGSQEVGPVLMVSFEELVLDPRVVFRQLAELMGWPMPEHFSILDSAAYQSTSSRDEVVQRLSSRSHLSEVTSSELQVLCSGLDNSLLDQLYENPHSAADVTYKFDCLEPKYQAAITSSSDAASASSSDAASTLFNTPPSPSLPEFASPAPPAGSLLPDLSPQPK